MATDDKRKVEFFFDFVSPASYLAYVQLPKIAAETGATIDWRPMLLGGVFKATNNQSPITLPPKGRWLFADLQRWAARWGAPFAFNPHFPFSTLTLLRVATGLQLRASPDFGRYCTTVFDAIWRDGRNMGDPPTVEAALADAGFDAGALLALAADPEIKQRLIATTDEAVARGAFGAPTFFVGGTMHWGQDRLDFVREALAA
jgi:2-hydroxychromene-2-carboxylate isomerase